MLVRPRDDGVELVIVEYVSQHLEEVIVGPLRIASTADLGLKTIRLRPQSLHWSDHAILQGTEDQADPLVPTPKLFER